MIDIFLAEVLKVIYQLNKGDEISSEHLSEIKSYFPTAYKVYQQMLKDALRR